MENNDNKKAVHSFISSAPRSRIKNVIAVISGKGGVGKSFTSSYLAVLLKRKGFKVGILDADITGPSIPFAFSVNGPVYSDSDRYFYPIKSKTGIEIMSSNLLLNNPNDPLVWRGPMISTLIEQFYTEVIWDFDYLIIDLAPGTSDISLTVFQKIKLSLAVLVSTPQELVNMVVEKSAKMCSLLDVPLISLIENMSYVICPDCKRRIDIYGKREDDLAKKFNIPNLEEIPFDNDIATYIDSGRIEDLQKDYLKNTVETIISSTKDE